MIAALWVMALAMPMPVMSQGRQGGNRQNNTERPTRQPQHRPGGDNGTRPQRPSQPQRPQQPGGQQGRPQQPPQQPGGQQGRPQQPPRPQQPGGQQGRPQQPPRPQQPGGQHGRPQQPPRPQRPGGQQGRPQQPAHCPLPHRNWGRPSPPPPHYHRPRPMPPRPVAPPPGYRPYVGAPAIRSILGITFGTLYGSALDFLYYNGYTIDGYVDNTIYLSDVAMLSLNWPFATLYCNGSGRLASAQFSYFSVSAAMGRYNRVYNLLCGTYGPPLSLSVNGTGRSVMWYGGGNTGYITLEYAYSGGGYYTTLSVSI